MKFKNPMLVVKDMEKSKQFYKQILGLHVILDFGSNITLTGGVCLQTLESWAEFIGKSPQEISFSSYNGELYFEEDKFEEFVKNIKASKIVELVHDVKEHNWGQRVIRFYDLDHHIIEVGENMKNVCKRFLDSGFTIEQTAKRMDVPIKYVQAMIK